MVELNNLFRNFRSLFVWMFCPTHQTLEVQTLEHEIETTNLVFPNGLHNPCLKDVKRNSYSVS